MRGILSLFILFGFLLPLLHAQVSMPPWNWSQYSGTSQWQVTVTEDQTACHGPIFTNTYGVIIQHDQTTAVMGDVGHGPATGTFISGNVLHFRSRTVSDPPGTSTLSDYDIYFTTDCASFAGEYTWDYSGSDGSCSGSTSLSGTNTQGCPAPPIVIPPSKPPELTPEEQVAAARSDLNNDFDLRGELKYLNLQNLLTGESQDAQINAVQDRIDSLEPSIEAKYKKVLDADPNNFEANVDMAELKRSQGLTHEYYEYMDRAANSGAVTASVRDAMEKSIARELGFSTFPKPANSLLMRKVGTEKGNWQGGLYGMDVPKESSDKSLWDIKVYFTVGPWEGIVKSIVVN
ncbi:MAG: hypothetical protein NT157_05605 [Candidatus Micrarchaeota archaeon]|nr:hypothetical protein [Candidatus Micrarchaeota archaeon]